MVVAFLPGFFDHASAKLLAKQDLNGIPVAVNDECHQIEDLVSDIISVHLFLAEISERGYTLFCGAKDLYFGTKTLCVTDLSDTAIVDSEAFDLIITAMAIKRYGTEVLRNGGKQE